MAARLILRLNKLIGESGGLLSAHSFPVTRSYSSSGTTVNIYNGKDPAPFFFDNQVQGILKRLTGLDFNVVFRTRKFEKRLNVPKYEFLTDEELQEATENAKEKAEKMLQMPPVLRERQPINVVLSRDPALHSYDTNKHIFCDITFGMSDKKRTIVVRDVDGTLRQATWDERERMNQIYNPRPGRKVTKPKMFLDENLKGVIGREKYEFILDRACAQFEPDDPEYQKVCSMTYEGIEEKRHYHMLHSTRHYGPMCFYLAWHKSIDNMLISLIQDEKLSESADLIQLYHSIHKDCKSALLSIDPNEHLKLVKAYVEEDSLRRPQVQLAIQQYEDLLHERQQYDEAVQASHGL